MSRLLVGGKNSGTVTQQTGRVVKMPVREKIPLADWKPEDGANACKEEMEIETYVSHTFNFGDTERYLYVLEGMELVDAFDLMMQSYHENKTGSYVCKPKGGA